MKTFAVAILAIFAGSAHAGTGDGFPDGGVGDRDGICGPSDVVLSALDQKGYRIKVRMIESAAQEGLVIFEQKGVNSEESHFLSVVGWVDGIYCITNSGDTLLIAPE